MKTKKLIVYFSLSSILLITSLLFTNYSIISSSISSCEWPTYDYDLNNYTKVMFISDIHLRENNLINYWENYWREWQMHTTFVYATTFLKPDYVFILGDIFDNGVELDDQEFHNLVIKFNKLFSYKLSAETLEENVLTINGNHDIGFHYETNWKLKTRFDRYFQTESVKLFDLNGINFVTINSITLEGDYCQLCSDAEQRLNRIGKKLCPKTSECPAGVAPIVLTHFPLYRQSDSLCDFDLDSAPESLKYIPYEQKFDCLSGNATKLIINSIKPRLVITGHTHYGCVIRHTNNLYEWTVSSFNYRMNYNPSLLLLKASKTNHSIIWLKLLSKNQFIKRYLFC